MKEKAVIYRETYEKTYTADGNLSDLQAVTDVSERIWNGENGPEECVDSGGFVPLPTEPGDGEQLLYVPIAYERYGRIPVIVPKGITRQEVLDKAQSYLEGLDVAALEYYTSYLSDSEEVDEEGIILEKQENGETEWTDGQKPVTVFQIDLEKDQKRVAFLSYRQALQILSADNIQPEIYQNVYTGELPCKTLEEVFLLLNTRPPKGYRGHSLSVSDVVKWDGAYYYCDTIGFRKIPFSIPEEKGV